MDAHVADMARSIGKIEGRLDAQDGQLSRIEAHLIATDMKLETLVGQMNAIKGGWKTLAAVGLTAGGIGAFISKMLGFLK
jgi:hypothetical protein